MVVDTFKLADPAEPTARDGKGRTGNRISHDLLRIIMQLNLHSDLLHYGILVERAQHRRQRNREVKRWGADYNLIALVNYEW